MEDSPTEMIFKIIIIGDLASGKTNILSKYLTNTFEPNSTPTIGVEMKVKDFKIKEDLVKAQFWDTAGQEKYDSLTTSYYKGAKGALIVYDITQKSSFDKIESLLKKLRDNSNKNVSVILVGNKCDLEDNREVLKEDGEELAQKLKIKFMEVSAKTGENLDKLFQNLIDEVYEKYNKEFKSFASIEFMDDNKNINLNTNINNNPGKKSGKYIRRINRKR